MKYRQSTPLLSIPVVGYNDSIMPEIEMRKYRIIENMLLAGMGGVSEVVFDDGTYSLESDGDTYTVGVHAGGTFPSMHGIVDGCYFRAALRVAWEKLKQGRLYYLYVRVTPKTSYDSSAIRLVSSTTKLGHGALLMAVVDLREDVGSIDSNPPDKCYAQDVAVHASQSDNPHGAQMSQDSLNVCKSLSIEKDAVVRVGGNEVSADAFSSGIASLAGHKTEVIDFSSGGPSGVTVQASQRVLYAMVQSTSAGDNVGQISMGYFHHDDNVDTDKEFAVYNDGEEGAPMKALAICG